MCADGPVRQHFDPDRPPRPRGTAKDRLGPFRCISVHLNPVRLGGFHLEKPRSAYRAIMQTPDSSTATHHATRVLSIGNQVFKRSRRAPPAHALRSGRGLARPSACRTRSGGDRREETALGSVAQQASLMRFRKAMDSARPPSPSQPPRTAAHAHMPETGITSGVNLPSRPTSIHFDPVSPSGGASGTGLGQKRIGNVPKRNT